MCGGSQPPSTKTVNQNKYLGPKILFIKCVLSTNFFKENNNKEQGKTYICRNPRHKVIKMEGVKVERHMLTSARGADIKPHAPALLAVGEKGPGTHCIGSWTVNNTGWDISEKK